MADVNLDTTDEKPYDPADYTVPEVLEHISGQHPDEVTRILAAEEAGKARSTILASTVAAEVEETQPDSVEDTLGDQDPYALVRAKDSTTGAEYTTTRVAALSAGSTVLDKPALDAFGQFVPTKTVLDLRAETNPTEAEADGQPGTDTKEN